MGYSASSKSVRPWHIANTTVRSPSRLRGGLEALVAGGFEGDMKKDREEDIALALNEAGVISLAHSTTNITSIARKWRSVLVKLGFLWPDATMLAKRFNVQQSDIGEAFSLTPNGRRLLSAKSLRGEQEVMLRAVSGLLLPNAIEPRYSFPKFSPLKHVVGILGKIQQLGEDPYISRLEMASIVLLSNGEEASETIANQIISQRKLRISSTGKRKFDAQAIRESAQAKGLNKYETLYDYQDVTFRYLKSTGLFQSRGRGITLVPEKLKTAQLITAAPLSPLSEAEYIRQLALGVALPTDTRVGATEILADLRAIAKERSITFDDSCYDLRTPEGMSLARHELEEVIFREKEIRFAADQANQIDEILAYLKMLDENRSTYEYGEEQLVIPKEERPAYFEWLLWRVLLALGELVIPPNEVRRFKIDQDFLPVSTAAGGGADVVAEYQDSVVVVEVTLTENSRQEAAEGEPVRRHVADGLAEFGPQGKAVYGLFVARRVDTNTAETFRNGVWYQKDDERVNLDIVPLTLSQLRTVLTDGKQQGKLEPSLLIEMIITASLARFYCKGAPEWQKKISEIIGS